MPLRVLKKKLRLLRRTERRCKILGFKSVFVFEINGGKWQFGMTFSQN